VAAIRFYGFCMWEELKKKADWQDLLGFVDALDSGFFSIVYMIVHG